MKLENFCVKVICLHLKANFHSSEMNSKADNLCCGCQPSVFVISLNLHAPCWARGDVTGGWRSEVGRAGRGGWVWPKAQLYCLPYWLPLLLSPSFIFISSQLHQISNSLSCITNLIPPFFCGLHYAVADDSLAGVRVNSHENATPADGEAHKKYDKQSASVPSSARTRYKLLMRSRTVCVCVFVCMRL